MLTLKPLINPVIQENSTGISFEYAKHGKNASKSDTKGFINLKSEREKLKEMLLPFIKETVKKQLKEERDYYKSRPSMAAKQLESIIAPTVAVQVYGRMEERLHREMLRKGR